LTPSTKSEPRCVALYARVSTNGHGKSDGQTTQTQLHELRRYCEYKRWRVAGEYVDQGVSGAKTSRPALDRLMDDAAQKKFDVVLIWRFDRFGRSTLHLLNCLETFKKLGIDFVSTTEQIDTSTANGELFFTISAAFAKYERAVTAERIKAKLRYIKETEGRVPGPKRRVEISADEVQRRRAGGESLRAIARSLGCSAMLLSTRLKKANA
jgi:DNA invertase Pin-like site-specific DNA recombinase